MPPLIAAVLLGAGAYAGFSAARRLWERLSDAAGEMSATASEADGVPAAKDLGALERDPATGVYRPAPRDTGL